MYNEIVKQYYDVIYNYCFYKLSCNKSAAEDVTQEVFFVLFKKFGTLQTHENIKIWLYRTADLEIKKYLRKQPHDESYEALSEELTVEDDYPSVSESNFDCLTSEEKELLLDYYFNGNRERIAKDKKLTLNGLYTRIYRIKKKLARYIDENNKTNT